MEGVVIMSNQKQFYILIPSGETHPWEGIPCYKMWSSHSKKFLKRDDGCGRYKYNPRLWGHSKSLCFSEQHELFNVVKANPEAFEHIIQIKLDKRFVPTTYWCAYTTRVEDFVLKHCNINIKE